MPFWKLTGPTRQLGARRLDGNIVAAFHHQRRKATEEKKKIRAAARKRNGMGKKGVGCDYGRNGRWNRIKNKKEEKSVNRMDGWTGKRKKTIPPLFQRRNFAVEDGNKNKTKESRVDWLAQEMQLMSEPATRVAALTLFNYVERKVNGGRKRRSPSPAEPSTNEPVNKFRRELKKRKTHSKCHDWRVFTSTHLSFLPDPIMKPQSDPPLSLDHH